MKAHVKGKFSLGQIVATPSALAALARNGEAAILYLQRHASGDWGALCDEDKRANEDALLSGARILSAYILCDETKLWVITEAAVDGTRNSTCLLLPEEY